jgi:prevent-host-death family protein
VSTVIPQRDLRNHNAAIIAAVVAGESFVVTRNGEPVAELRPVTKSRRTFVPKADLADVAKGSTHIDSTAFRADLDRALDARL